MFSYLYLICISKWLQVSILLYLVRDWAIYAVSIILILVLYSFEVHRKYSPFNNWYNNLNQNINKIWQALIWYNIEVVLSIFPLNVLLLNVLILWVESFRQFIVFIWSFLDKMKQWTSRNNKENERIILLYLNFI